MSIGGACSEEQPSPGPSGGTAATAEDAQSYVVRGQITELPEEGKPMSALRIRHEAIDNFVGRSGRVIGMSAMTMEFPVAAGVSLDGLAVGQKVEFTFVVSWGPGGGYRLTQIRPLTDDTELEFRAARPPIENPQTGD